MRSTQRGGGGKKIPQICGQTVHRIWTRGVKKSENFADVINGSPPKGSYILYLLTKLH